MRILELIADGDQGGAQRHVWELVQALGGARTLLVSGSGGWLSDQAGAADAKVEVIPGLSRHAPLTTLGQGRAALGAIIRSERIDIVHAHGAKALFLAKWAVPRDGPGLVATSHGLAAFDPTRPTLERAVLAGLERWRKGRVEAWIGVSSRECDLARGLGIAAGRIHRIPNGVALGPEPPSRQGSIHHLAFVGRLVAEKGVRVLPEIVTSLPPDAILHVAGDGPLREWLERQAKAPAVRGRLVLEGWVDPVGPWLGQMDGFLLPSRKEGLPYALLEAAAQALPIVAFSVGGVGDVLVEGVSGRVVPAGQDGAFLLAVQELCRERLRPWDLGRRAREAVRQRFTVEQMRQDTLALYRGLLREEAI
ncbi:MAG: glycosyltransferase family 4 protein [Sulfobacillus sp.]